MSNIFGAFLALLGFYTTIYILTYLITHAYYRARPTKNIRNWHINASTAEEAKKTINEIEEL